MTEEQPSGGSSEQPEGSRTHASPEVGSVGEEAVKLLGALSQWAREHAEDPAHEAYDPARPGPGDPAEHRDADGGGDPFGPRSREGDHAEGSWPAAECRWCPVCRVVHAVRQTSPEVREHLVAAAGSLLEAASGLLATQVPRDGARGRGAEDGGVEHIDLDPPGRPGDRPGGHGDEPRDDLLDADGWDLEEDGR